MNGRGKPCWRAHDEVAPKDEEFKALAGAAAWDATLVRKRPYLQEAAETVATKSCGEGWMLQPKIQHMPKLEYRCAPVSQCMCVCV